MVETAEEAGLYNNDLVIKVEQETLEKFKEEGVQVIEVDQEEFRKAAEEFYLLPDFTSIWSEGLYETVKNSMK